MKVKRVLAGISLFIVAFVVVATIIMSSIKLDYGVNCATPDTVTVGVGSLTSGVKSPDKDQQKAIIKYINEASTQTVLNGLFNGSLGKKAEIQSLSGTNSYTTLTSPSRVNCEYFVIYKYNQPQKLKVGKKDYLVDGNPYLYKELYFGIKQTDGETEINVYVNPYFYYGKDGQLNYETNYHYYYVLDGDFDGLLRYLKENWVG